MVHPLFLLPKQTLAAIILLTRLSDPYYKDYSQKYVPHAAFVASDFVHLSIYELSRAFVREEAGLPCRGDAGRTDDAYLRVFLRGLQHHI